MQSLVAREGPAEYSPGFAWVGSARIPISSWMGLRFLVRHSNHPVEVERGGLAAPSEVAALGAMAFDQPPIEAWLMAARLEPTWVLAPRLRLWLGLGAGWLRILAPPTEGTLPGCTPWMVADTEVSCRLATGSRTGLGTELDATLGATVELVPRWLALNVSTGLGAVLAQSGTLYASQQAIAAGSLHRLTGFPSVGASSTFLVGLGLML
ncbi:MAG: hypothetical protein JW751_17295 [Polyangiaceae bacterium]|nr:hypothetical protein [Polyangiaceae bacterium]